MQGLPISYLERARACRVTDRQLALMVGNAIPTIVLKVLVCRSITKIGRRERGRVVRQSSIKRRAGTGERITH